MFESPWLNAFVIIIIFMAIIVEPIRRFIHYSNRYSQAFKDPHTVEEWKIYWQNKTDKEVKGAADGHGSFPDEAREAAKQVSERREKTSAAWSED
jgi:hypothetical protein